MAAGTICVTSETGESVVVEQIGDENAVVEKSNF
jgi:hypothetical protein